MTKTLFAAVMALLLGGCAPSYIILQAASPNPIAGQHDFVVAPVDFTQLRVGEKSEADYLAGKTPEQRSDWDDKLALNERFRARLEHDTKHTGIHTAATSAPFVLHPIVRWLEPGWHGGIVNKAAVVKMTVRVTGSDGKLVDEIELEPDSDTTGYTVRGRLENLGGSCGYDTALYLKSRTSSH